MKRARRTNDRERGSALVVALVLIMVVGMVSSAALTYTSTSLEANANAIQPDRASTYAAGGAVDLAVKYLDANTSVGVAGGASCGDTANYAQVVTVPATGNAPAVTVNCKPASGSGTVVNGNGLVTDTMPKYGVLALGTHNGEPGPYNGSSAANVNDTTYAERGIDVQKSSTGGTSTVNLGGSVYSNAPIRKGSGAPSLTATTAISARGACENTPSTSPACTVVPYATAATADPGYPYRTPDLTPQTVPNCSTGTLVKFTPGWYPSASAINSLFATCKNKDFWFQPGVYYFDFRDTSGGTQCRPSSSAASDALHEWCIGPYADSKATVVGGVPVGWTAPTSSSVTLNPTSISQPFGGDFTPLSSGKMIDGSSASATWTAGWWQQSETATLSSFGTIPASVNSVDAVSLDITSHVTQGPMNRSVSVTAGDGTDCGTYTISADATTVSGLESCLSSPSRVNGASVQFEADSQSWFQTKVTLDGARFNVSYTNNPSSRMSFPGGCDPNQTGVQFIFGGDSRVYVSDGSFELCAGPNPDGTATTAQQIAIYGVPPVTPIVPTATATVSATSGWTTISNASKALAFGEQSGIQNATITVQPKCGSGPGNISCSFGSGSGYAYGAMRLDFAPGQFALPANTTLGQVELHASYNQYSATFDSDYSPEFVVHQYQNPSGWSCSSDMTMPATDQTEQFWKGISTSCLTPARLAAGFSVEWRARIYASCSFNNCGSPQSRTLDGMEVRVALSPSTPSTQVMIPENGCIAPFPNEYVSNSGTAITNEYGTNVWNDDSAPDCALLMWDAVPRTTGTASQIGCYSGQVSLQGTLYAPGAAVDFDQAGPKAAGCTAASPTYSSWSYPLFGRGAIVRTLRIRGMRDPTPHAAASCGSTTCGGVANDRQVTLQATVNGNTKVVATVKLPADGSAAKVLSWTVS